MIDAYVFGDDLSALTAALDLAEVGLSVRVARTGSPLPETAQRDSEGALVKLIGRLVAPLTADGPEHANLAAVQRDPAPLMLRGPRGQWAEAPTPNVLGIPAVPLGAETIALLGGGSAFRAYLDRVRPVLTIGKTREFGALVDARIGKTAREYLVDPLVYERFGRDSAEIETAVAAPGLNEALSRAGSLTGAVLASQERNVARETLVEPGGGWQALREALVQRLVHYGVDVREEAPTAIMRDGENWRLTLGEGEGSEELTTRSLICVDSENVRRALGEESVSNLPTGAQRVYAKIGIHRPDWVQDWHGDALCSEVTASGVRWSVRLTQSSEGDGIAELQGPAVDADGTAVDLRYEARNDLEHTLRGVLEAALMLPLNHAEWQISTVIAPEVRQQDRDRAARALDELREMIPTLVMCGSVLQGGDDSAAVMRAESDAVHLRRTLLGLTE